MMKLLLVAGARPNFMKIASIIEAIDTHNRCDECPIDYLLVHTGQHYDEHMSQAFFKDLDLPQPHVNLAVGSASHAQQTAEIMRRFEPIVLQEQPDVVLVVGDVNSTLACSLVASKVTYSATTRASLLSRPLVAHVEAGLRSYDRSMPEEINRILTDVLSDLLFITEQGAEENLLREGIPKEKIHFVGNTMVDTLLKHRQKAQASDLLSQIRCQTPVGRDQPSYGADHVPLPNGGEKGDCAYAVVTLHRPSNVDDRETFQEILEALWIIAKDIPILFPIHPRTMKRITEFHLEKFFTFIDQHTELAFQHTGISGLSSLGYLDFLCLLSNAKLVLTDSGGLQEEATALRIPCVTLRPNTERPVTITHGTNVLAGTKKEDIIHRAFSQLNPPLRAECPKYWDGRAGERIVKVLLQQIVHRDEPVAGSSVFPSLPQ
jgi:UDP-N-acetylglucosamine 2-epimerase (non-hydrolysing)